MEQSDVICGIYESVCHDVAAFAEKSGLFSVGSGSDCAVYVEVADVAQCMFDKSGQRIVVDEKQYEQPACYEMCLTVSVEGKDAGAVLKSFGALAVHFKDNPAVDISKWKWHGCQSDKVYLEPVIRHADFDRRVGEVNSLRLVLAYKTEFSLNSRKASGFKRVEKRDIRGYVKK